MITNRDKLDAVERELKLRRRVYPNRVETGRMSADFAALQIAIFEALADDLRGQVEGERLL
jgi:hypothetical protein